jgi:hypothetical protein
MSCPILDRWIISLVHLGDGGDPAFSKKISGPPRFRVDPSTTGCCKASTQAPVGAVMGRIPGNLAGSRGVGLVE